MFRWGSITEGMLRQLLSSTRLRIINLQLVNSLTDELFKVENTIIAWFITKVGLLWIYVWLTGYPGEKPAAILGVPHLGAMPRVLAFLCPNFQWTSSIPVLIFFKQQRISKTKFNWFFQAECQSPWTTPLPKWTSRLPPCLGLRKVLRYLFNLFSLHIVFFQINNWIGIKFASPV